MAMNTKQKLGDVAKDLNVPTKELVDLLSSADNEKKRTTALSAEELNLVFETYTKKTSIPTLHPAKRRKLQRLRRRRKRRTTKRKWRKQKK